MNRTPLLLFVALWLCPVAAHSQPAITGQPVDQSVSQGANVTFTVKASGLPPLAYQWFFRDQRLTGATNQNLILTHVQVGQSGSYAVDVRDATGSISSKPALLEVDPAFSKITAGPVVTDAADGQGAAWVDFDGDGSLDLFVSADATGMNVLYHNDGGGIFTPLVNNPISQAGPGSLGAAWADLDNDGRPDLFVSRQSGPGLLFRQQLDGTFARTILPEAQSSWSAAWADYDNDGFADLLAAGPEKAILWHNDGAGNLVAVTNAPIGAENALSVTWVDYDNDGDPDLFVTSLTGNCQLYRNDGGGVFVPILSGPLVEDSAHGSGAAWGDYDNDGYADVFLPRRLNDGAPAVPFLYHNNGDGTFTKVEQSPFTEDAGDWTSATWGDYDNDGWLDLFVTGADGRKNRLYHNNHDGTFTRVLSGSLVNDSGNSSSAAWGDFDHDGFLDLFVANGTNGAGESNDYLYHNNGNGNAWIIVQCAGTISNRSALGTKVRVLATIGGEQIWQVREITGAGGAPLEAHFGLGDAQWIDQVRIEWPSGIVQVLSGGWSAVALRQVLKVTEPPQTVEFAASSFRVPEDGKEAVITVTQNAPRTGPIRVDYAAVASTNLWNRATPGADFLPVSGTLLFAPGETQKTFTVPIVDDGLVEGDETVALVLSNPSGHCVLGTNATAVLSIQDNETPTLIDPSFHPAIGTGNTPSTVLVQPDGKILVGGQFWVGGAFDLAMRLNSDGSRDTTFRATASMFPTTSPGTAYVYPMALQPDGKIVIGGVFSTVNGVKRQNIARLETNGLVDLTFVASVHTTNDPGGSLRGVEAIAIQSDGKIVISGAFDSVNGTAQPALARLNPDGTLDAGDIGHVPFHDYQTLPLPDGRVLVGGDHCLTRLNPDGSPDPTFLSCPDAYEPLFPLAVRADGKILVRVREQVSLHDETDSGLARLNPDGSLDRRYTLPKGAFGNDVFIVAGDFAADGSALVAVIPGNGSTEPGLVRLFPDGTNPGFQVATDQLRVDESGGTATLVIQRTGDTAESADVTVGTVNGSARAGQDYLPLAGTIHFAPLETSKTISIPIVDNPLVNPDLDFQLKLTSASAGVLLGSGLTKAKITIADNEHPGRVDATFRPPITFPTNFDKGVYPPVLALQADGKILVGGALIATNPATGLPTRVTRLNPDGSLDLSWRLTVSVVGAQSSYWPFDSRSVYALAVQSNRDILIGGGAELTLNDQATPFLGRVHPDGSLDASFAPGAGTLSNLVQVIAIQPDGRILVAQLSQSPDAVQRPTLVRLTSDGRADLTWNMPALSGSFWTTAIYSIVPSADGKVLIAGDFTSVGDTPRNAIARLNSDGSLDRTFNPGAGGHGSITAMALQADGKIIVAGDFDTFNGAVLSGIARLKPDGTLDKTFSSFGDAGGASVSDQTVPISIAVQTDGRILLGGAAFSAVRSGVNQMRYWVARLNTNGTLDVPFDAGQGLYAHGQCCGAIQAPVSSVLSLPDGNVLAGGGFTSVDGVDQPGLVRLRGDPAPRLVPTSPGQLTLNGLPGRVYVIEDSTDLQTWTPIQTNRLSTYLLSNQDPDAATQPRRFYRAVAP